MIEDKHPRTQLSDLGEFGLIDRLTAGFETKQPSTLKSVGDDAAVIDFKDKKAVISTDLLIEGVHFDLSYVPLKHLGYKAVSVNVSDIYAMNARATQITVSIAVSNRFPLEALEELYAGIHLACKRYEVDLVGGDTTSSTRGLIISVTAIGEADEQDLVYRNGAKENDLIVLTGDIGGGLYGLADIRARESSLSGKSELTARYRDVFVYFRAAAQTRSPKRHSAIAKRVRRKAYCYDGRKRRTFV